MRKKLLLPVLILVFLLTACSPGQGSTGGPAMRQETEEDTGDMTDGRIHDTAVQSLEPDSADDAAIAAVLSEVSDRKRTILDSPTEVEYTGTAYYVAADGDDDADGRSENPPGKVWKRSTRLRFGLETPCFLGEGTCGAESR